MKKVLVTAQIIFLLNVINPYLAQATFPGENIIFGNSGQSNEQNNKTLMKIFNLATKELPEGTDFNRTKGPDLNKNCDSSCDERLNSE